MTHPNSYRLNEHLRGGVLQIQVFGEIGPDFFDEGMNTSAQKIDDVLAANPDVAEIEVRINSGGGSVFDGIAIHTALRQHPAPKAVFITGIAASAASVVAMAGDTITMGELAMMMIHNATNFTGGDNAEHAKQAEILTALNGRIAASYIAKTGASMEDTLSQMAAETWFTAEEAVSAGLATDIFHLPEDDRQAAASLDLSKFGYRNVPTAITASAQPTPKTTAPTPAPTETNDMKIIAQAAGLTSDATEGEIALKVSTLSQAAGTAADATARADVLQANLTALTAAIGCEGDEALGTIKALQVSHAKVEEVTAKLADIEKTTEADAHAALIAEGQKAGKLTADLSKFYADKSAEELKGFLKVAGVIVPMGKEHKSPDAKTGGDGTLEYNGKTFGDMKGLERKALKDAEPALWATMRADFYAGNVKHRIETTIN